MRPAFISEEEPAQDLEWVQFRIHSAGLLRSFAKVGFMHPYAVVFADGAEVHRTATHRRGHKAPCWDELCSVWAERAPARLTVAVRSASPLGKDVLCGEADVPWTPGSAGFTGRELELRRRGRHAGALRLSLRPMAQPGGAGVLATKAVPLGGRPLAPTLLPPPPARSRGQPDPPQLDVKDLPLAAALAPPKAAPGPGSPASQAEPIPQSFATALSQEDVPELEAPRARSAAEVLAGRWICVATWGLEEFLKASGVGVLQRKVALSMKWPTWDFTVYEGRVAFVNNSQLGDLKEEIIFGSAYVHKDARGNLYTCSAEWEGTANGGVLRIARRGSVGVFREERRVDGDTLAFALTDGNGASWGRTFKRA